MSIGADIATQSVDEWPPDQSPHRNSEVARSGEEVRKLIESFVANVDRLALNAATVMSGVNTLRDPDTALKATEIEKYLPCQEDQLPFMLLALSEMSGTNQRLPDIKPLLNALHDGRQAIQDFICDEERIGRERARIVNAERLILIWSGACTAVSRVIDETNVQLRLDLPLAYRQNSAVLTSLLSGTINGLSTCLNNEGHLYLPDLPQQRRWPRYAILQNCVLKLNDKKYDAFVVDASAGGLGLEHAPEMARNSQIKVTMENGRVFHCTVAWSTGERAGLKFTAPLSQSDPLLIG